MTTSGATLARSLSVLAMRIAGVALLAVNAGIHLHLWKLGYRTLPTIGTLFLLDTIAAAVLALAVLATPRRWLAPVAAAGMLLEAGTVGGLFLATEHSLFGFTESSRATLYWPSAVTEIAGAVVLAILVAVTFRRRDRPGSWW